MRRFDALDRLRALALVLMVVDHVTRWLSSTEAIPALGDYRVTEVAAPVFAVTSGMSVALAVARRPRGWGGYVVRRYGRLVLIGVALHWFLWRDPLAWGVLEMLGIAVPLAATLALRPPLPAAAVVAGAALVAGPALRAWADGQGGNVDLVLGQGFPLGVYAGLAAAGVVAGRLLHAGGLTAARVWAAAVALSVLAGAGWALGHAPGRHPGTFWGFVVPSLAATAWCYLAAGLGRPGRLEAAVRRAGTHTLGVFVWHYLGYGVLRWAGWKDALAPVPAMWIGVAAGVAAVAVAGAPVVDRLARETPARLRHAARAAVTWRGRQEALT